MKVLTVSIQLLVYLSVSLIVSYFNFFFFLFFKCLKLLDLSTNVTSSIFFLIFNRSLPVSNCFYTNFSLLRYFFKFVGNMKELIIGFPFRSYSKDFFNELNSKVA